MNLTFRKSAWLALLFAIASLCFTGRIFAYGEETEGEKYADAQQQYAAKEAEEGKVSAGSSFVITVKKHGDMDRVVTVSPNGDIELPLIGALKVEGVTISKLKEMLGNALSAYIKNPEVDVQPAYGSAGGGGKMMLDDGSPKTMKIFQLKNSDAVALADALRGIVSVKGSINAEKSSNSLVVSDTDSYIEAISKIVNELDSLEKKTKQVLIEAEIVELTVTDARDMSFEGIIQHISKDSFFSKYNKQIALPASITSGSSSIGRNVTTVNDVLLTQLGDGGNFFFGDIYSKHKYQMYINAMIDLNKAKIIANPKIVVENNQKANIQIVTSYPYRELSGSGIVLGANSYVFTTKFLDYGILLPVIPHIKENGMINLELEPEVSFIQGFNEGVPIRVARRAVTQVNVINDGTIVIGGLVNERTVNNVRKVPVLGDIPLVGIFFRNQSRDTEKTELIIFITPKILNDEKIKNMNETYASDRERIMNTEADCKPFNFGKSKKSVGTK